MQRGDKTMLDVWLPAADAAAQAAAAGKSAEAFWADVTAAAENGASATRSMVATKGRAARVGERSLGHMDPAALGRHHHPGHGPNTADELRPVRFCRHAWAMRSNSCVPTVAPLQVSFDRSRFNGQETCSSSTCYSDLCASHKTRGAVGNLSEDCNLSSVLIVLVTAMKQRRVCGAGSVLSAKDLVWLDSCDKHRNEEIKQVPWTEGLEHSGVSMKH